MTIIKDGVTIKFPEKLQDRQEEIIEFAEQIKCNDKHYIKVWENKRHDLLAKVCRLKQ